MAIQFTANLEQFTTAQRTCKAKQFTEFASKKQLANANILLDSELEFVNSIKGVFSISVHVDRRYVAVTLYKASAENKYQFIVLDLVEKAVAVVPSIKIAKQEILELVNANQAQETQAQPAETAVEAEAPASPKKSKKSNKKSEEIAQ